MTIVCLYNFFVLFSDTVVFKSIWKIGETFIKLEFLRSRLQQQQHKQQQQQKVCTKANLSFIYQEWEEKNYSNAGYQQVYFLSSV